MNRRSILARLFYPVLGLLVLVGCSPYDQSYSYSPRPARVEIRSTSSSDTAKNPVARVYASIIGIRSGDPSQGIPTSVHLRLRVENSGAQTLVLDPHTLELIGGDLLTFPPPVLRPPLPIELAPTGSATLDTYFPLPPQYENSELGSLRARWFVQLNGQRVEQLVDFRRIYPAYYSYYDPLWAYPPYPYYGWYGGVVVVRHY